MGKGKYCAAEAEAAVPVFSSGRIMRSEAAAGAAVFLQGNQLFDLLFQFVKLFCREELSKGDVQTIAELFDCRDGNFSASVVKHAVCGGRRNAGEIGKLVNRDIPFSAQLQETRCYNILDRHDDHLADIVETITRPRVRTCVNPRKMIYCF